MRGLWQDPSLVHVRVHLSGWLEAKSLVPICVRLTAATEGGVDVVNDLSYDHFDQDALPRPLDRSHRGR